MKTKLLLHFAVALVLLCLPLVVSAKSKPWRAVHLLSYDTDADLDALGKNVEVLAKQGINVIILEVDYNFEFKSHPELRRGKAPITRHGARWRTSSSMRWLHAVNVTRPSPSRRPHTMLRGVIDR